MSDDGGNALDNNVLIEEDLAQDALAGNDGERAKIDKNGARRHAKTERKAKGKKRRTESSDQVEPQVTLLA